MMIVFRLEGEEEEPEGQDRGLRGEAGLRVWVERLGGESGWREICSAWEDTLGAGEDGQSAWRL